ncbi:hypothetical protein HD596_009242 [Nonomuraea jabiensis]|uniref:Uncharacterized protein n=1 Tax=Nonomuraea jabiensis TaxID=882448 RepID=A0A7W9LG20_9ACTN|nr:hypothetical protein [Nonomuraea jabiensis]
MGRVTRMNGVRARGALPGQAELEPPRPVRAPR